MFISNPFGLRLFFKSTPFQLTAFADTVSTHAVLRDDPLLAMRATYGHFTPPCVVNFSGRYHQAAFRLFFQFLQFLGGMFQIRLCVLKMIYKYHERLKRLNRQATIKALNILILRIICKVFMKAKPFPFPLQSDLINLDDIGHSLLLSNKVLFFHLSIFERVADELRRKVLSLKFTLLLALFCQGHYTKTTFWLSRRHEKVSCLWTVTPEIIFPHVSCYELYKSCY